MVGCYCCCRSFLPVILVILLPATAAAAWQLGGISLDGNGVLRIRPPRPLQPDGGDEGIAVPPAGTAASGAVLDCVEVRDTGNPKKGFGAFCVRRPIPKHAFLGFYPGKKVVRDLDRIGEPIAADNPGEYLLSLDGGLTFLDGHERAQDRSTFAPVHLNHADRGSEFCNCLRKLSGGCGDDGAAGVAFFAKREIQVGEELCFDYGSGYWRGREADKV